MYKEAPMKDDLGSKAISQKKIGKLDLIVCYFILKHFYKLLLTFNLPIDSP